MRITVTGATGLIGTRLVAALRERGDEVTVLSRNPENARRVLGVEAVGWNPEAESAPDDGLAGRDGVVHLAGEPIAQRWTHESKESIRASREHGTAHLIDGVGQSEPRPAVLVTASAVGYYGARGDERLDEDAPAALVSSRASARPGNTRPPRPPVSACASSRTGPLLRP